MTFLGHPRVIPIITDNGVCSWSLCCQVLPNDMLVEILIPNQRLCRIPNWSPAIPKLKMAVECQNGCSVKTDAFIFQSKYFRCHVVQEIDCSINLNHPKRRHPNVYCACAFSKYSRSSKEFKLYVHCICGASVRP